MKKEVRNSIANKTNNRCAYCGDKLKKGWHLDHMKPIIRTATGMERPENHNEDNFIASCPQCNLLKTSGSIEYLRDAIIDRLKQLSRQASYRTAIRYGILKETKKNIVFYFEKIGLDKKLSN